MSIEVLTRRIERLRSHITFVEDAVGGIHPSDEEGQTNNNNNRQRSPSIVYPGGSLGKSGALAGHNPNTTTANTTGSSAPNAKQTRSGSVYHRESVVGLPNQSFGSGPTTVSRQRQALANAVQLAAVKGVTRIREELQEEEYALTQQLRRLYVSLCERMMETPNPQFDAMPETPASVVSLLGDSGSSSQTQGAPLSSEGSTSMGPSLRRGSSSPSHQGRRSSSAQQQHSGVPSEGLNGNRSGSVSSGTEGATTVARTATGSPSPHPADASPQSPLRANATIQSSSISGSSPSHTATTSNNPPPVRTRSASMLIVGLDATQRHRNAFIEQLAVACHLLVGRHRRGAMLDQKLRDVDSVHDKFHAVITECNRLWSQVVDDGKAITSTDGTNAAGGGVTAQGGARAAGSKLLPPLRSTAGSTHNSNKQSNSNVMKGTSQSPRGGQQSNSALFSASPVSPTNTINIPSYPMTSASNTTNSSAAQSGPPPTNAVLLQGTALRMSNAKKLLQSKLSDALNDLRVVVIRILLHLRDMQLEQDEAAKEQQEGGELSPRSMSMNDVSSSGGPTTTTPGSSFLLRKQHIVFEKLSAVQAAVKRAVVEAPDICPPMLVQWCRSPLFVDLSTVEPILAALEGEQQQQQHSAAAEGDPLRCATPVDLQQCRLARQKLQGGTEEISRISDADPSDVSSLQDPFGAFQNNMSDNNATAGLKQRLSTISTASKLLMPLRQQAQLQQARRASVASTSKASSSGKTASGGKENGGRRECDLESYVKALQAWKRAANTMRIDAAPTSVPLAQRYVPRALALAYDEDADDDAHPQPPSNSSSIESRDTATSILQQMLRDAAEIPNQHPNGSAVMSSTSSSSIATMNDFVLRSSKNNTPTYPMHMQLEALHQRSSGGIATTSQQPLRRSNDSSHSDKPPVMMSSQQLPQLELDGSHLLDAAAAAVMSTAAAHRAPTPSPFARETTSYPSSSSSATTATLNDTVLHVVPSSSDLVASSSGAVSPVAKPGRVLFVSDATVVEDATSTNVSSTSTSVPVLRQTKSSKRALAAAVAARQQAEEEQAKLHALKEEEERAAKLSEIVWRLEQLRAHRRLRLFAESFILNGRGARNRRRRSSGMTSLAITPITARATDAADESLLEEYELGADQAARRVLDYAIQTGQLPASAIDDDDAAQNISLEEILRQRDLQEAQRQDNAVRIIVRFLRLVVTSLNEKRRASGRRLQRKQRRAVQQIENWWVMDLPTRRARKEVSSHSRQLHRSRQQSANQQYSRWMSAVGTIQRLGRAFAVRRNVIGCQWHKARRQAQFVALRKVWKMREARRDVQLEAGVYQHEWRLRQQLDRQRGAAIQIQKIVRAFLARRRCKAVRVERLLDRRYPRMVAAKRIQRAWRRHFALRRAESLRLTRDAQFEVERMAALHHWAATVLGRIPLIQQAKAARHQKRLDREKLAHHAKLIQNNNRTDPRRALRQAKLNKKFNEAEILKMCAKGMEQQLTRSSSIVQKHMRNVLKIDVKDIPKLDLVGSSISCLAPASAMSEKEDDALNVKLIHRLINTNSALLVSLTNFLSATGALGGSSSPPVPGKSYLNSTSAPPSASQVDETSDEDDDDEDDDDSDATTTEQDNGDEEYTPADASTSVAEQSVPMPSLDGPSVSSSHARMVPRCLFQNGDTSRDDEEKDEEEGGGDYSMTPTTAFPALVGLHTRPAIFMKTHRTARSAIRRLGELEDAEGAVRRPVVHEPFARWTAAHGIVQRIFDAAAVYAWKMIFSHTAHDAYRQSQLPTEAERQDRLQRVRHRNQLILACYDTSDEQAWLSAASKNIGFVGRIWNPIRYLGAGDEETLEQRAIESYEFVERFLMQCFPLAQCVAEIPDLLVSCGLHLVLKDAIQTLPSSITRKSQRSDHSSAATAPIGRDVVSIVHPVVPQHVHHDTHVTWSVHEAEMWKLLLQDDSSCDLLQQFFANRSGTTTMVDAVLMLQESQKEQQQQPQSLPNNKKGESSSPMLQRTASTSTVRDVANHCVTILEGLQQLHRLLPTMKSLSPSSSSSASSEEEEEDRDSSYSGEDDEGLADRQQDDARDADIRALESQRTASDCSDPMYLPREQQQDDREDEDETDDSRLHQHPEEARRSSVAPRSFASVVEESPSDPRQLLPSSDVAVTDCGLLTTAVLCSVGKGSKHQTANGGDHPSRDELPDRSHSRLGFVPSSNDDDEEEDDDDEPVRSSAPDSERSDIEQRAKAAVLPRANRDDSGTNEDDDEEEEEDEPTTRASDYGYPQFHVCGDGEVPRHQQEQEAGDASSSSSSSSTTSSSSETAPQGLSIVVTALPTTATSAVSGAPRQAWAVRAIEVKRPEDFLQDLAVRMTMHLFGIDAVDPNMFDDI